MTCIPIGVLFTYFIAIEIPGGKCILNMNTNQCSIQEAPNSLIKFQIKLFYIFSYLGLGLMSARQAVLNFTTLRENGK